MKTAYVFSGQGAQYNRMGLDFYEEFSSVQRVFEEASEALNVDLKQICFNDDERLHLTPYTQPAILTVSHAIETVIKEQGLYPDAVAGLSLGEYTALVSAGTIDFSDGVALVNKRGKYMDEAVPDGKGKMAAIIGLESPIVEAICEDVSKNSYVAIANYNTPGQLVISGEAEGVIKARLKAEEAGAKKVIELNVSGPFHSKMLQSAADLFSEDIKQTTLKPFDYPVYTNVTAGQYLDVQTIPGLLTKQMTSSVLFEQMIRQMITDGIDSFVEIGPGKTLRSFIKSIDRNVTVKNIENLTQFNKFID